MEAWLHSLTLAHIQVVSLTDRPYLFTLKSLRYIMLLIIGGVPPKTCRASFKIKNNKNFDTLLHLVGFFTVRITIHT
jgi:hypothetical protein